MVEFNEGGREGRERRGAGGDGGGGRRGGGEGGGGVKSLIYTRMSAMHFVICHPQKTLLQCTFWEEEAEAQRC